MKSTALQNCNKCGLCLSVCPTYKVSSQEHASPRARLQLINYHKNRQVLSSAGLKEIISKCLMCGSCAVICPSGIDHYSQFMKMRTKMRQDHGEKPIIKSLIFLLAKEYRIKFAAGVAKFSQRIIPQTFIQKYYLGNIPVKRFPLLNKKPFRQAVPEVILPDNNKKGSVLYFTGCATNYVFDKTGFSTIKILKQMGYKIIIPEKQTCCGIPMLFHGAVDQAEKNISTNIECLSQDDIKAIIVDCPTCGSALKNEYPALQKKLNLDDTAAQKISSKVIDIMSFILQESGNTELFKNSAKIKKNKVPDRIKVTYHLPCHLKNGLQSLNNTETLIKQIPGLEYIKAEDVDECCGGGGTFFYEYPEISKQMVDTKLENVKSTGAEIWLTDCPVCRINLSGNLKEKDNIILKHPVEML
jgi:glycolate oxidase iron-sulfur subunit